MTRVEFCYSCYDPDMAAREGPGSHPISHGCHEDPRWEADRERARKGFDDLIRANGKLAEHLRKLANSTTPGNLASRQRYIKQMRDLFKVCFGIDPAKGGKPPVDFTPDWAEVRRVLRHYGAQLTPH